jgi:predicted nuclease of predicted toxin-antitoxin system
MSRRILLDECLPRKLADLLDGEAVTTVPRHGWASKRNGELLTLASMEFDVFVTHDENLEHQQSLADFDIGIVVIHAASNRLADIQPLREAINGAIRTVNPGCVAHVGNDW